MEYIEVRVRVVLSDTTEPGITVEMMDLRIAQARQEALEKLSREHPQASPVLNAWTWEKLPDADVYAYRLPYEEED